MTTASAEPTRKGGEWLTSWNPEDEATWNAKLAWTTLSITTFALTLAFIAWFLPSAIVPKLGAMGFHFTKGQLYWMAAMPGLSGGLLRLVWMVLPPMMGTRKMVAATSALLVLPLLGWAFAIQNPSTPFVVFMLLGFLAGIGGGAFSGFMPSTSFFFPKRMSGTALGIQAGIGNFGVSAVQLLTPYLIGFPILGAAQVIHTAGKPDKQVWYQNAALVWVPLALAAAVAAWLFLKSVPIKANIKQQFDIFGNVDTHLMTLLYIMTFGTFSGLSAQFGLMMANLYGTGNPKIVEGAGATAKLLIEGYNVPDPVKFVFLGPLVSAGARVLFSPLTDKMGGAIWTFISGLGLIASILYTIFFGLVPNYTSAATLNSGFNAYLWGMLAIFLFTGIGNASTFKQMPMIFEPRQAGGVIGWTAAIAAFGPFIFGVGLSTFGVVPFFWIGVPVCVIATAICWWRYTRKGAAKPS